MRGWTIACVLAGMMSGVAACNGGGGGKDPLGKDQIILDGQNGEGVIKRYSGVSKPDDAVAEGQGAVLFDVQHIDRLVNKETTLEVFPAGETTAPVGSIKGNESLSIVLPEGAAEGTYDVRLVYEHSEITRYEGEMKAVTVHRGRTVKYKVKLEAPVGFLDMRFLNDGVDVGTKVTVDLFQAVEEEGGERGEPLMEGVNFAEMLAVPAGQYDARALYQETENIQQEAWIEGLVVEGGMARLVHEYDFAITLHGFILHVKNFGEDVSANSTVYFYVPGANTEFAVAQDKGPAGERLVIMPGTYDVRAVYQPGPEQTTWGDKVLRDVEIGFVGDADEAAEGEVAENEVAEGEVAEGEAAEGEAAAGEAAAGEAAAGEAAEGGTAEGGDAEADAGTRTEAKAAPTLIEMEVDVEKPLGTLTIKALFGGEDVSDKAQLRAIFAGADRSAASAILAVTDLSTHVIPAGDYDILISFEESDLRGRIWFEGVHIEHGTVWEKEIDLREGG